MARKVVAYSKIAVAISPFSAMYPDEFYGTPAATSGLREGNLCQPVPVCRNLIRLGSSICMFENRVLKEC